MGEYGVMEKDRRTLCKRRCYTTFECIAQYLGQGQGLTLSKLHNQEINVALKVSVLPGLRVVDLARSGYPTRMRKVMLLKYPRRQDITQDMKG